MPAATSAAAARPTAASTRGEGRRDAASAGAVPEPWLVVLEPLTESASYSSTISRSSIARSFIDCTRWSGLLARQRRTSRRSSAGTLSFELLDRRGLLVEDLVHRLDARLGGERLPPRGRLVEDAAEREDVGAVVDGLALHLLGRHVARGADHAPHLAGGGERRVLGEVRAALALLGELGEAEVEHLREAVGRDHDVAGLQVAVDDPGRVGLGQPLGRLRQVAEERAQVGLVVVDQRGERLAAHELHRDVVHGVRVGGTRGAHRVVADLVDRDDVGVVERGRGLSLEHEAPHAVLVPHQVGRQDLERDAALELAVLGEVDLAHPALGERGHDPVVRDLVLGTQRPLGLGHSRPPGCDLGREHSSPLRTPAHFLASLR